MPISNTASTGNNLRQNRLRENGLSSMRDVSQNDGMQLSYLEDFHPGQIIELGSRRLERDEIIEFARKYDPQPFHVDEAAGRRSIYGGLIASGWHTVVTLMRMMVETVAARSATMGSPGIDEIRFVKPVRPGDTLSARMTIRDVVPSRSKPDRGFMRAAYEVSNQHGETVMTMVGLGIYGRRPRD
jgi:acyl dehydratase